MSKPYLFSKSQVTLNALKNPVRFSNAVRIVTPQPDGKILVGGDFLDWGNIASRNYLIRLNSDGTLDVTFTANASDGGKFSSLVNTIAIQSDGKILVGGDFNNYSIAGRNNLIRLNSDGTVDNAFCINATDGNKFLSSVNTITIQPDGKILVGGAFTNYNFIPGRSRLIRLNSDGTLDTTFTDNASNNAGANKFSSSVFAIAIQSDGKILVGGIFTSYNGTINRNRVIRLNSDGTTDTAFCVNASDGAKFSSSVSAITIQPDGKILVGGAFSNYAGTVGRNTLIRLNSTGTLDAAFCVNASDGAKFGGTINTIAIQSDGKILLGGTFVNYAGTVGRNRLIRLNLDGTTDNAFCTSASDGSKFINVIVSVSIQSDGTILVGGFFTDYAGFIGRSRLIKLNLDGTTDSSFCRKASDGPQINNDVSVIEVSLDGKILVGGAFTNYANVVSRNYLIRLNSDGTIDAAFCGNASDGNKFLSSVGAITIQPDGKILVGGAFINYNGTAGRSRLIRLNSDGTLDTAFCVNASDGSKFNNTVNNIAIQLDGKVLAGGIFTNYNGTASRDRLIRLNSDGTLDTVFCVNASDGSKFNNTVQVIAIQSGNKILVGGIFTNYNGTTGINNLIQLNNDGTLNSSVNNYFTNGSGSVNYVKVTPYETFFANNSQFRFAYFDRNFDVI